MRELVARRVRVDLEEADRGHDEAGHAERALESLLVNDRLLHGVQRAVGGAASPSMVTTRRFRTVWVSTEHA